jgi:hypothetical protein
VVLFLLKQGNRGPDWVYSNERKGINIKLKTIAFVLWALTGGARIKSKGIKIKI